MSEQSSSRSLPFKSKKPLMDSPSSKPKPTIPNSPSVAVPTPEKPPGNMLTRSRNRSVALSVKEIRQAVGSRRRSEDPSTVHVSSAKSRLVFTHDDSSSSSSSSKRVNTKENLPEKYENLSKFFDAFDSSIRLSKLRGSKPTFLNISRKIEHLTERRFCYSHLAQLKHILPEAIEIKRVLVHDETTCCMKPDLHVTLDANAVEANNPKSESKVSLRKVFRERLVDFVKAHPQGDEVPEEPLPELYTKRKVDDDDKVKSVSSVMEEMSSVPIAKLISSSPVKVASTPVKSVSSRDLPSSSLSEINIISRTPSKPVSIVDTVPSTPAKIDSAPVSVASTPPAFASTPARLISTSRSLKRSSGSANPNDAATDPPAKLARRSLIMSLSFDEDEKANDEDVGQVPEEDVLSDDEILSILPYELRQSIKEQERKAIEERDPAISQAKRRRKMIACLPKLFNVVHYLIQSIRRWVITKEELVHKIIAGHSDITDRKEVEEQLMLMQELVPKWISEKRSSSGDVLICINKLASPQTIRSDLEEENRKAVAQPLS